MMEVDLDGNKCTRRLRCLPLHLSSILCSSHNPQYAILFCTCWHILCTKDGGQRVNAGNGNGNGGNGKDEGMNEHWLFEFAKVVAESQIMREI